MKNVYGSLVNRLQEGRKFGNIKPGTDITRYSYSDRSCYYITRLENDKHIFVKPYLVCADQDKEPMSQEWKYFKTPKEMFEYLNKYTKEYSIVDADGPAEEEWVYRYNHWYAVMHYTDGTKGYRKLDKISFGVKDYYYDYEF